MQKFKWTKEKVELLKKLYPTCMMDELVVLLGINNKNVIRAKACTLKLSKDAETIERINRIRVKSMHTDSAKKKKYESMARMVQMERLRIKYGLKQCTKRVFSPLTPREQRITAKERYQLRKLGYVIDKDNKKVAYYTDEGKRNKNKEKYYEGKGYTFKKVGDNTPTQSYDDEPMPYTIII